MQDNYVLKKLTSLVVFVYVCMCYDCLEKKMYRGPIQNL